MNNNEFIRGKRAEIDLLKIHNTLGLVLIVTTIIKLVEIKKKCVKTLMYYNMIWLYLKITYTV